MSTDKHIILSDVHAPDYSKEALGAALRAIKIYKPNTIHLLGDIINFTDVSSYDKDIDYDENLQDEIVAGTIILDRVIKSHKGAKILWYEGNHERRLQKYLSRQASELANLKADGERIISVPHLLGLKKKGVEWIPYEKYNVINKVVFNHGTIARIKSGYAAHASLDKTGVSGIQGHSHKLALVSRTRLGMTTWFIENGCLCNIPPKPTYAFNPDWQHGFTTITFEDNIPYPQIHPIIDGVVRISNKLVHC